MVLYLLRSDNKHATCQRKVEHFFIVFFHLPPSTVVVLNRINVSMSTWAPQIGCHSQEHPSFGLDMPKMAMETPNADSAIVAFFCCSCDTMKKTDTTSSGAVPSEEHPDHWNPAMQNLDVLV